MGSITTTRMSVVFSFHGMAIGLEVYLVIIKLPPEDFMKEMRSKDCEVRHASPSLFPSFSTRSRMGVILMLCGTPSGSEGLTEFLKRKGFKMNKNLYVGNLSFKVTDEDLKSNFSEAGEVASAAVIKDKFTGQSKGFGFVEMKTDEGAAEAIKKFNGGMLDGKAITVNEARPKKEFGAGGGGNRGGGFRGGRSGSGGGGGNRGGGGRY
jgi:hypothetical protein